MRTNSLPWLTCQRLTSRDLLFAPKPRSIPLRTCSSSLQPHPGHVTPVLVCPRPSKLWDRGAKKKSSVTLEAIPQGALSATSLDTVYGDDEPSYPSLLREVRNNMRKFPNCVVLTRVGNFYEVIHSILCLLCIRMLTFSPYGALLRAR